MISNNLKKEILNDWAKEFQELSEYAQNKLYMTIGPFVVGLEILKLPRTDDYRPTFVCYPLWKPTLKECLEEPVFMQEIKNNRGFQFNIPYVKHNTFFQEAVDCTKKQAPVLFDKKDMFPQNIVEIIDIQFSHTLIKSSPVGQAKLFEAKLFAAVYVNDMVSIKNILRDVNTSSKIWSPDLFEWKFGNIDNWVQSLEDKVASRDEFIKQIEIHALEMKKILKS